MTSDPWETIETLYPVNSVHKAKVSTLTDYGFFAELDKDTEGLVHVSEIDWTNKNIHPSKVCLLYTSPSPRDLSTSRMPSSA